MKYKAIMALVPTLVLALAIAASQVQSSPSAGPAALLCLAAQEQHQHQTQQQPQQAPTDHKHAYHEHPSKEPLPKTMDPEQFRDNHRTYVSYARAGQIREILYQLPCYCDCDKDEGHTALLDCFVGWHGKNCHICQREAVFAYEENQRHKTVEQIRAGLASDEPSEIDMNKYVEESFAALTRQHR